jgi:chitinase
VAPYAYVSSDSLELARAVREGSAQRFVLAFVLAKDGKCDPVWTTGRPLNDPSLLAEIAAARDLGATVTVASGGAVGTYLENRCESAEELAQAYRTTLEVTGADRLDLDVEQDVPVARVADAAALLREWTGAGITVTVEVLGAQRGLVRSAMRLLRAFADRGLDPTVNAMVMNFYPGEDWRAAMLTAADRVAGQIARIWPEGGRDGAYARLGLTFMAGRNDTDVITTLGDAHALRNYARAHSIGFLGFWSLNRDNGGCPGRSQATNDCSGIEQQTYAFTRTLA